MLLVLFLFTSTNAFSRFGCIFDDENYALNDDKDTFSDVRNESVVFNTEEEFNDFYNKVDDIRRDEVQGMVYNTLDTFLTMFDDYVDRKNRTADKNLSLSDFYKSYRPTYPPSGDDGIPALIRVYEKIISLYPGVADSFVLASKDLRVDNPVAKKWMQNHNSGDLPNIDFQHEQVVGLIRISVAGELGFILIDMYEPKAPTPVVMHRLDHPLNRNRTQPMLSNRTYLDYRATFTYQNDYISIATYNHEKTWIGYGDQLSRRDLLYTARSLCSFLQYCVKGSLFNPTRSIERYTATGEFVAYVALNLLGDFVTLYTTTPPPLTENHLKRLKQDDGYSIDLNLHEFDTFPLTSDSFFLYEVQLSFGFTGRTLIDKLRRINIEVRTELNEGIPFRQALGDIDSQLHKPAPAKRGLVDKYRRCFSLN